MLVKMYFIHTSSLTQIQWIRCLAGKIKCHKRRDSRKECYFGVRYMTYLPPHIKAFRDGTNDGLVLLVNIYFLIAIETGKRKL